MAVFVSVAIPKPVGLYPLNKAFGAKDAGPNGENGVTSNVDFATGPDGKDNVTVINFSKIAFIFPRQVIGLFKSRATLSTNGRTSKNLFNPFSAGWKYFFRRHDRFIWSYAHASATTIGSLNATTFVIVYVKPW